MTAAPKTRPLISGETTLAELQAFIASVRACRVEVFAMGRVTEPSHFKASLTVAGEEGTGSTLAAALDDALRIFLAQAEDAR